MELILLLMTWCSIETNFRVWREILYSDCNYFLCFEYCSMPKLLVIFVLFFSFSEATETSNHGIIYENITI